MPANSSALAARMRAHLHDFYLPFWSGPALDHRHGGWMAWLSNDLSEDRGQPKGLIVNARILWAFSAVYRAAPRPMYQAMADRAFDVVMQRFWDLPYGGAFWRMSDDWQVRDDAKKTYGQSFYIYALTEFYRAFGQPSALARAQELFELIERHAHDERHGGYFEVCRRDWTEAGPEARLSDKDQNEKKSMNNHLHVLEAYTNLYRVWPDERVAGRLRELLELFLTRILDPVRLHLHHFFDEQWRVRSDSYTFGHDIEASWLWCEAADLLGDAGLRHRVQTTALRMAEKVLAEGISEAGALYYEGRAGAIIDAGCECWPQAEAIVGFLNAYELSGQGCYLTAAERVWSFAEENLMDRTYGEWFWRINSDGKPALNLPKVSEWKGPYHISRACLEAVRRLA